MAYTIIKSDGTVLTTIADGTINTTSTSIGLPGRNYAGYGQTLDTNFVHQLENFADSTPPANPLRGQLWFNTTSNTMYVCPTDGETNASNWLSISATSSGTSTFGNITVTGNISVANLDVTSNIVAANGSFTNVSVSSNITTANLTVTTLANVGNLKTTTITTGANTTAGSIIGTWTANGGGSGNALIVQYGNVHINSPYGVQTDNYMYANGAPISFAGSYSNANVALYLPVYNGVVLASSVQTPILTTGAFGTSGSITGNWTLTAGSKLNATYAADLAERYAADAAYTPGTVVEIGGDNEITAVVDDLSDKVFGVVSNNAAYLMNSAAGDDDTHPQIALCGRVKVNVIGTVNKGDRLVSAGNGTARAAKPGEATAFNVIGRALVNRDTADAGLIEAFVSVNK